MPRLSPDTWAEIRALRETGISYGALAAEFGVSKTAIMKRAKAESWADGSDVSEIIRKRAMAKVTGVVAGDRAKKAEALDRAADNAASVLNRHRLDWEAHRQVFGAIPDDFEVGKRAKIAAEMLRIRHQGERIACGLEDGCPVPQVTITREW